MPAFILRFQEACSEPIETAASATRTETRQHREKGDSDAFAGNVMPLAAASTRTLTEVSTEASDDDRHRFGGVSALANLSTNLATASKTATAVKAEAPDRERPRPWSLAGTEGKTHTFVNAESVRTDPHRPIAPNSVTKTAVRKEEPDNANLSFQALPPCC